MQRSSDSMLRDFQIALLQSLLNIATPLIFCKNLISDTCIWDRTLSVIIQN